MKEGLVCLLMILSISFLFISFVGADMSEDIGAALAASGGNPEEVIGRIVAEQLEAAERNEPCSAQEAKVDVLMADLDNARGDEYKYECIRSCLAFAKGFVTKEAVFSWITQNSIMHSTIGKTCDNYGYSIDSCNVCNYDVEMPSEEEMVVAGMSGPVIEFAMNMPEMSAEAFREVEAGWEEQIKDAQRDPWDDYEDNAFEGLSLKEKFKRAFSEDYDDNTFSSKVFSLFSDHSPEALDNSRQLVADSVDFVGKLSGLGYYVLQPFSDVISPTTSAQEKILAGVDLAFIFAPAVSEITKSIKGLGFIDDAIDISKIPGVTAYKTRPGIPGMPNKYLQIEKGAVTTSLYRKKVFNPGNFDNLLGFGDDYLQMHISVKKGALGEISTAKDVIRSIDQLNDLGLKYSVVGDTPNSALLKQAEKAGAIIIESPAYQEMLTGGSYWLESKFGIVPEMTDPVQRIIFLK